MSWILYFFLSGYLVYSCISPLISSVFSLFFCFCITFFKHLLDVCALPDVWHLVALRGLKGCFNLFAPQKFATTNICPCSMRPEERHLFSDT